ncbi:hypothetical protein A1O1_07969 [Capronia coronata CBS 617.96]|uniref:Alpha box domain-containing protein n=1 Tax=Capronia coronata CBS 617.96 TaxID=1182541 RepID=W9XN06_9EURO|nr:uncharacterized protein A1O1_07969 [Capronia coronata CBS 617.96]EXJ81902.1 hypothetical protein A1O1_07969 [Capronia coronata CBS 617.96]
MAANNKSGQAALATAINSLTPAQLSALTASVAAVVGANPLPVTAGAMATGVNLPQAAAAPTPPINNPRNTARRGRAAASRKKPLNGFMTFRSYYSTLFAGLTQKDKSGLIRVMWGADLKKPMWTLLGYAYSDLRDHHDESLAIDKFLAATVPLLPIVPADQYLSKMGWELTKNNAGELTLARNNTFGADNLYAEYPARTSMSMADIINHCYEGGLLNRNIRRATPPPRPAQATQAPQGNNNANAPPPPSCGGSLVLAVTPQQVNVAVPNASTPTATATATLTATPTATSSASPANSVMVSRTASGSETQEELGSEGSRSEEQGDIGELTVDDITSTPAYLSIQHVTADQQAAFESNALALHFHPRIQPPILGFDPRVIQDDFDPFDLDLSGLVDWEA